MMAFAVVFVGAGIGGALRHGMNVGVARLLGTHFPYHTFLINIVGSLVMGLIAGWFVGRPDVESHIPLFLMTGILGGFTTFSAFSLDALLLWERPGHRLAGVYVGGSVAGGVAGLLVGLWIMKMLG
jgi:CrcB protein